MRSALYDYAHSMLVYDPETGVFTSRVAIGGLVPGQRRDLAHHTGYRTVKLRKRKYWAHRVAWLMMTGAWPTYTIDHINRDPGDNRWSNLRDVTLKENCQNRAYVCPPAPKLHFLYRKLAGITSNLG